MIADPLAKVGPLPELTTQLAEEQVRLIHSELRAVVTAAESAMKILADLTGPEPGDFAAMLKTKTNMGAGYFRSALADIEAAWRKKNKTNPL